MQFGRKIEKAEYSAEENKVKFSWRNNLAEKTFKEEVFDYALVTVPFTQVRRWQLPSEFYNLVASCPYLFADCIPAFSSVLGRAIAKLEYNTACKVSPFF